MGLKRYKKPGERTQPVTGVTPRNDEELAQFEVECREGKPPHFRVLFCPWNMHLHLAVQTCVRQRKPRLLGMATFDGVYRFEERGIIGYDIGPHLDPPLGHRPNPTDHRRKAKSAFTGESPPR